jgi:energy-coupling factor transport system permease protein
MLKDITLGQFFPGNSLLHKIDPRFKIILTILYIVIIFLAGSIPAYAAILLFSILLVVISRIPLKTILKSLKPIVIILVFTSVLNIFWTNGERLLVAIGPVKIYYEGVKTAVLMVIRIVTLLVGTTVILTYTTSPIMLTDGIERLLSPLKVIKVPVHEFSLMMTIALRFIPTLIEETDKIMSAQTARGANFTSGGLISRAKALIPVLIPLFISSFRRADELATAMECRCYHGGSGRTKMNVSKISTYDVLTTLAFILIGAAIILLNQITIGGF